MSNPQNRTVANRLMTRGTAALRWLLNTRFVKWVARSGRGFTVANIVTQGGIIVTGGVVRLTGSGLGCSTAPKCEPESFWPDFRHLTLHTGIEFGNRTLTVVLVLVALGVAFSLWTTRPALKWHGLVPLVGVLAQAVLGAVTVHVELHPAVVAPHLLISTALVWQAVWLALAYRNAPRRDGKCLKKPLRVSSLLLAALLVLGAFTTGAGPHSGDAEAAARLNLDLESVTRIHALTVWAFILVLGYIVWRVRGDRSLGDKDEVRKAWIVLVAITFAQGAIGYAQYLTGLPEVIVGFHLAGAAALTAAHSAAHYLLRRQRPAKVSTS